MPSKKDVFRQVFENKCSRRFDGRSVEVNDKDILKLKGSEFQS